MKILFIAAAIIVGTPALAQDATPAAPPAAAATPAPDAAPAPTAPAAADAAPAPSAPVAPAAAAPAFTPTPVDSASLPTCSRKITDKCINPGARKKAR
jgi:hypothetical protein